MCRLASIANDSQNRAIGHMRGPRMDKFQHALSSAHYDQFWNV